MKKSIFNVLGLVLVLSMTLSCQKGSTVKGEVKTTAEGDGTGISAEDRAEFIRVFEDYLSYSKEYADSAAKKAGATPIGELPANTKAEAHYQQNRVHGDSLMHKCIALLKNKQDRELLRLLEAERVNIYTYPGNTIDNELNLGWIVENLYKEEYKENEDSFYIKMLPWYEFSVLHMEMLKMLGKGDHPEYETTLGVLFLAYKHTRDKEKMRETLQKIIETGKNNPDSQYYDVAIEALEELESEGRDSNYVIAPQGL